MPNPFFQFFIRTSAFLRKEIYDVLRQPRLLLTLVLGPFLILLVFGIGYQNRARALRTLFVAPENSALGDQIEEYATTLGPQLIFAGVVSDEQFALEQLRQGEVDLVALTPENADETIRSNEQAVFTLYHREIDPFQVDYVQYFGQIYINEVNRRVLLNVIQQLQSEAADVEGNLEAARQNAESMHEALEEGNLFLAFQKNQQLIHNLDNISLAVGASLGVLSGVQETIGGGSDAEALLETLRELRDGVESLEDIQNMSTFDEQTEERISGIENDLVVLENRLESFTNINPSIVVRPFRSEATGIARVQPTALDFFAPAVVALLLQHLAVTFAALSIVRERTVGTLELFRVSPLTAEETILGKYLSYTLFSGVLTLILTLLLVYVLQVPMLGSWVHYWLVIFGVTFTSLSIGFLISLLSRTDSQAVQLTMIVLLTSVFFSGFLMSLEMIIRPVRVISWMLPTTYGIVLLRDIALRGIAPDPELIIALFGIGIALTFVALLLLRRLIATR